MNLQNNIYDISAALNINESAVRMYPGNVLEKGLLQRIGADRGGYWEVWEEEGQNNWRLRYEF
jgi:hypothetical protein